MSSLAMIGIPARAGYWDDVLAQLGLPTRVVESVAQGIDEGLRVFAWNRPDQALIHTRQWPVAVLTDHGVLNTILGRPRCEARAGWWFQMPDGPFGPRGFWCRLPAFAAAHEGWGQCMSPEGPLAETGLAVCRRGAATFYSLPWDLSGWRLGTDAGPRPYQSPPVGRQFVEIGSAVDSGALRRLIFDLLLAAFRAVGLPLIRVATRPACGKGFAVRIDADGFSHGSTDSVLQLSEKVGFPFTWFIDVQGWGRQIERVEELRRRGQQVELHCYRHATYASRAANRWNLRTGRRILERRGIACEAVASPFGYHPAGFAAAIAEQRFRYSSEFAAGTDDLPFFPGGDRRRPLQVPTHPACIGRLLGNGFSPEESFRHLNWAIRRGADLDGAAVLYSHPLDRMARHVEDYRSLIQGLLADGYRNFTLGDHARRWRRRPELDRVSIESDGRIHVDMAACANDFPLELWGDPDLERVLGDRERLPPVMRGEPRAAEDHFAEPSSAELQRIADLERVRQTRLGKPAWKWWGDYLLDCARAAWPLPSRRAD